MKKAKLQGIRTTGQLRSVLASAVQDVLNGTLEIEKAAAVHKLAKNISESLYSETKIAMFRKDVGQQTDNFGELGLGDPNDN